MPGSPPPKAWLSPEVVDQVIVLGREAAPLEACGLILPNLRVVGLPNNSPLDKASSFAIRGSDLVDAIESYVEEAEIEPSLLTRAHFIIWHTHPSGLVGPSRGDMRERLPDFQYAVVTLPGGVVTHF